MPVVLRGAKAVAAGSRHSMMLGKDGSVWATGHNLFGQLGDGLAYDRQVFVRVISDRAKAVAAGAFHSMVIKQDGSVWATGSNEYGQFGDGSTTSEKIFVKLAPFGNGSGRNMIFKNTCHVNDIAIALTYHVVFFCSSCLISCHVCLSACSISLISHYLTRTLHLLVVFASMTQAYGIRGEEPTNGRTF